MNGAKLRDSFEEKTLKIIRCEFAPLRCFLQAPLIQLTEAGIVGLPRKLVCFFLANDVSEDFPDNVESYIF